MSTMAILRDKIIYCIARERHGQTPLSPRLGNSTRYCERVCRGFALIMPGSTQACVNLGSVFCCCSM